jgi:type II restriction enzyme
MLVGNKGEWSELYALLKLISDKKLFTGDADLNKVEDLVYPIIKIIRAESEGNFEYELHGDLVFISNGERKVEMPISTFQQNAAYLLKEVKSAKSTFKFPELDEFFEKINCHTLKAKSTKKTDILIVIHDLRLNQQVELGFSIKSQLGNDSTLLNAGRSTNFIYEINNYYPLALEIEQINNIDTRSKIRDRIEHISNAGGTLNFLKLENPIFQNNLILIDSLLPNILSNILKVFFTSPLSSIMDIVQQVHEENPLNFDQQFSHTFYQYKVKRFLTDVALGMMPASVWSGIYDATGGYLIVKEDGDVLCYHIYNRNAFEDYLYKNTKFETASSTRHDFGRIYESNGKLYFKLNLQIRFK